MHLQSYASLLTAVMFLSRNLVYREFPGIQISCKQMAPCVLYLDMFICGFQFMKRTFLNGGVLKGGGRYHTSQ